MKKFECEAQTTCTVLKITYENQENYNATKCIPVMHRKFVKFAILAKNLSIKCDGKYLSSTTSTSHPGPFQARRMLSRVRAMLIEAIMTSCINYSLCYTNYQKVTTKRHVVVRTMQIRSIYSNKGADFPRRAHIWLQRTGAANLHRPCIASQFA